MKKEIENKRQTAPQLDGKRNETAIDLPNRNGKPTTGEDAKAKAKADAKAKAKAKARANRRKAKKVTKNQGEIVQVKIGNKNVGFYFIGGINLTDFITKNKDVKELKLLDKKKQESILNACHNKFALAKGRFETIKVGKESAKWSQKEKKYRAYVSMQGMLRRDAYGEETAQAYAKDEAKTLASLAERKATI
jgi:hypothetical protein